MIGTGLVVCYWHVKIIYWHLKMGLTCCSKMTATNYQSLPCNKPTRTKTSAAPQEKPKISHIQMMFPNINDFKTKMFQVYKHKNQFYNIFLCYRMFLSTTVWLCVSCQAGQYTTLTDKHTYTHFIWMTSLQFTKAETEVCVYTQYTTHIATLLYLEWLSHSFNITKM
jgi:hypothetical protein